MSPSNVDPDLNVAAVDEPVDAVFRRVRCPFQECRRVAWQHEAKRR